MSSKSSIGGTDTGGSDKSSNGRDHLVRRAEVRAMTRGLENDELTLGNAGVDELACRLGRDDVLATLEDQCRDVHLRKVRAVVGCESDPSERLGDLGIGPAEAVRQFFAEFG